MSAYTRANLAIWIGFAILQTIIWAGMALFPSLVTPIAIDALVAYTVAVVLAVRSV